MNSEEKNKNKKKMSSEDQGEERKKKKPKINIVIKEEVKEKAIKEEVEEISDREDIIDFCEGCPDSAYPTPPVIDEVMPDDHVIQVDQEPPPEDEWYCEACGKSCWLHRRGAGYCMHLSHLCTLNLQLATVAYSSRVTGYRYMKRMRVSTPG
jgi:hypothetical protein